MYFHYAKSFYFYFPFALLIGLFLWSRWKRKRDLLKLADWRLLKELIPLEALIRRRKKDLMALIGLAILIFAAAGPQFGARLKEVKHRGVDVFIAMDSSRSMLAEDIVPSRLARAKRALSFLIQKLEGNRVGIIAFAKFAVIQCPLTIDNEAARMFLDILDVNTVPVQGTSIGDAIRLAIKSFPKSDKANRAIVLLTDGEDHQSDPVEAAKLAREENITIFTIGIGSTKGEVIKKKDDRGKVTEFHKYKGELVLSRLDDALLTKISTLTGGKYFRASSTDREIDEIANILTAFDKQEFSTKMYKRLQERYQYFAFLAFLFLLVEFLIGEKGRQIQRHFTWLKEMKWEFPKRSKQALSLFLTFLFISTPLWANLKNHVLKGNKLIKKGDYTAARGEFESAQIDAPEEAFLPYNIATTYYLEGNFEEAKVHYDQAIKMANNPQLKSRIAYNMGHLLFFMKDKQGAIDKFKESLKYNPKDLDAKYNIEYIRSGKEPKNPPQQQQKNQQQQQQGKKGDENKESQDEKDGQGQDQQEQKQEGDLSKEDAERILQLIQGQEAENLREKNPARLLKPQDKEKENQTYEDW